MTDIPELTDEQLARAIPARVRERLILGQIESGDVAALRRVVGLSQSQFALAMGISVYTHVDADVARDRSEKRGRDVPTWMKWHLRPTSIRVSILPMRATRARLSQAESFQNRRDLS